LLTAGLDYVQTEVEKYSLQSSLTISSGEIFGSFNVKIIDDTIQEQNETFHVTVQLQHSCLPLSINGKDSESFEITIIDNEGNYIAMPKIAIIAILYFLRTKGRV